MMKRMVAALAAALSIGCAQANNPFAACYKPEMRKIVHENLPALLGMPKDTHFKIARIASGVPLSGGFSCDVKVIWPTGQGEAGLFGLRQSPRSGNWIVQWQHFYYFDAD